jgi:hypothetical protein
MVAEAIARLKLAADPTNFPGGAYARGPWALFAFGALAYSAREYGKARRPFRLLATRIGGTTS